MSSRDWIFRIHDILNSIIKIQSYLEGLSLVTFKKNNLVIRNFEIIGEASKHVPLRIRQKHSHIPWLQMSDMRNLLIHEYFGVDLQTVWFTAKKYLPQVRVDLESLVSQIETQ